MEGTLLLNATYEPIMIISWEKAITLMWLEKAETLAHYEREVRSVTRSFQLPAVMRLRRRVKYRRPTVRFNRTNIYIRDNYQCQYCTKSFHASELTYDHVVPKSRGGRTTWTNIVTCCVACNRQKGCHTPEQAHMKLMREPAKPSWLPVIGKTLLPKDPPAAWKPFLWHTRP